MWISIQCVLALAPSTSRVEVLTHLEGAKNFLGEIHADKSSAACRSALCVAASTNDPMHCLALTGLPYLDYALTCST